MKDELGRPMTLLVKAAIPKNCKTEASEWDELGKRVATAHANYVIEKIDRLNCPTWQKLELLQAVIDTTKGTYKPKEHQKPGWQPSR